MAKAFFGDADPMNQNLQLDTTVVRVTGSIRRFSAEFEFCGAEVHGAVGVVL
jgi:hypothetical protein